MGKTGEEPAALPDISTTSVSTPSSMAARLASQTPKNSDADDMGVSENRDPNIVPQIVGSFL